MESLLQDRTLLLLVSGIFGALFGSFATALIHRLPREINWVSKRSACSKCEHVLGFLDLIPLFSYLFTAGKCRYCKTKFGRGYFFVELLMAVGFIAAAYLFGPSFKTVVICMLVFATIIIFVVDFEHYIIPDEINILIFITGLAYAIYNNAGLHQYILMPLFFFALAMGLRYLMFFWKKKEGLGLGDVKFFLAAGTFLSIESLSIFLFISGFAGLLIAAVWKLLKKGDIFPFGPALAISLLFCVAFPESNQKLMMLVQELIY